MKKPTKKDELINYIFIIIGTTILATGVNVFYSKHKLVTGGLSGLAIVIEYVSKNSFGWAIPIWFTNIVVNIPLFIIGIKLIGRKFGGKSIFAATFLSFAFYYTSFIPAPNVDLLLASIFGGCFVGVGIGFVLRASATTGGTDLAASIIKVYFKNIPIAKIMLAIDTCIISIGCVVFGIEKSMYALISVYIISKVIDNIVEGIHFSKAVFIVSDESETIAEVLMKEIPRGATGIKGRGMYTKADKEILFVVVAKNEIVQLQKIVKEIDNKAFITVADVREVLGEGFIE